MGKNLLLLSLLILISSSVGSGQSLSALDSPDISTRMSAFYGLTHNTTYSDAETIALIGLLHTETVYMKGLGDQDIDEPEGYSSYYSDIITLIASLRDPRSISVLIDVLRTGNLVASAIAGFGGQVLPNLASAFQSADPIERFAVVSTLSKLTASDNPTKPGDSVSRTYIRIILAKAMGDPDPDIRSLAQTVKTSFGKTDVVGDLNDDGKVDCADVQIVKAMMGKASAAQGFDRRADTNLDGIIDIRDLAFVSQQLPAGTHCQ